MTDRLSALREAVDDLHRWEFSGRVGVLQRHPGSHRAEALYIAVVRPETIWWDDLTPEMQDGWRRGVARAYAATMPSPDVEAPIDLDRLAKALCIEHGPEFDEARLHVDDACHVQARSVAATYARLARAYEAATPAPEVDLIRCSIPACNGDHEPTHYHVAQPPATTKCRCIRLAPARGGVNTRDEPRRCIHGRTEKQACAACNENTEDRTEEIAREYAALALLSPDTGATR